MPRKALEDVQVFAGLSHAARVELLQASSLRVYAAGETVLKRGELGRFLYAIASGTVSVKASSNRRETAIVLGAGEVFGEMSLLSGVPVSATVTAERESQVYLVPGRVFDRLFAGEPAFRRSIADLLANRLRHRTTDKGRAPCCTLIGMPAAGSVVPRLLMRGVEYYARGVGIGNNVSGEADSSAALIAELDTWRTSAGADEYCILPAPLARIDDFRTHVRPGDAVLLIDDGTASRDLRYGNGWDMVDFAVVRIGCAARRQADSGEAWSYRLEDAEIAAAAIGSEWNRSAAPVLDSIARWITRRTIGIALGAGAALGFAHIGVLGALDAAGVPIDSLSGSSMGGIVALLYAISGSAHGAFELAHANIGSNKLIRDISLFPRAALFHGRKVRNSAERVSPGKHFADLTRPVSVVATDLIHGDRVVLNRGPVASAFLATSAIPGVFPPFEKGASWLVDGVVVSRVPVDLLERWRSGLKIAVTVHPDPNAEGTAAAELRRAMGAPFGLVRVIARSWELLGFSHCATDTQDADIVISANTDGRSAHDFSAIREIVEAGRVAAERELSTVIPAVQQLLKPRAAGIS
jgi:NTE family protein